MSDFQATLSLDISKAMADAKQFESYMTSLQNRSVTSTTTTGSKKEIDQSTKTQAKLAALNAKTLEKVYADKVKYEDKMANLDARTLEKVYANQLREADKLAAVQARQQTKSMTGHSPAKDIAKQLNVYQSVGANIKAQQDAAAKAAEGFGMKVKRALFTVNGEMQSMAVTMGVIGAKVLFWTLMTGAVFGTIGAVKGLFTALKDIDYTLIELEKVVADFADSNEQLNKYMDSSVSIAKQYGREFGESFTIGLKAMRDFVRMGRSIEEAQQLTRTAMAAVNIAAFNQDDAIKSLTSTIHQFNMSASDSMRILDAWNALENKSGATAQDLAAATEKAGSAFRLVGASMHELNAISSAMIKVTGESGDTVGTTLKMMASRYADINMKHSAGNVLWKVAGITILNADKTYKSFTQTLGELSGVWGKLDDTQKATILKSMAGARHFSQAAAVMNSWDQVIKNLTLSLDSAGSSMTENDRFMRSWQKQLEVAGASIQELSDTSRKQMIPALIDMTKFGTGFVEGLISITEYCGTSTGKLVAMTTAVGALVVALTGAATAGKLFTRSNLTTLVITGLVTGIVYLAEKSGEAKVKMAELNAEFKRQSEEANNLYKNYSDLGNSFAVFQATYQGQIKNGKDGKDTIDQLSKALDKEGVNLSASQKKLLEQSLATKNLTLATKTFYDLLNQVKNVAITNKLEEQETALKSLKDTIDKLNRQKGFVIKNGLDTTEIDTQINNTTTSYAKLRLEHEKTEKDLKTALVPETTKPKIDMEALKDFKWLMEMQKSATKETELYGEKLEKLSDIENMVTIALAKEGRVYDESAVKKQILATRTTLMSEKYIKLKTDLDSSNESYLKFLNVSEKIAKSNGINTKGIISYSNGIITLNDRTKNLIQAKIEQLSIDDESKNANKDQILALDNIIQRNKEFEDRIKDQKSAVKSTIEEISNLASAYASLADIADGTAKVLSGSLKTAIKETFLSFNSQKGFDVTRITESFNKVTDDLKEKFASNISEGIINSIYTPEVETELDRLANSITKAFTGPSEKDKRLEEFKNATQALEGIFGEKQIQAIIKNPEQAALIEATSKEIETQLKLIDATEQLTQSILGKTPTGGTGTTKTTGSKDITALINKQAGMAMQKAGMNISPTLVPEGITDFLKTSGTTNTFNTMSAGFGQGGMIGSMGAQAFGLGKQGSQGATIGGGIGGAIGSIFGPVGNIIGSALGSLAGGLLGGDEDRKQKERQKAAKKAVNEYNDALNRMSPTMDETREKMDALTNIIKKVGKAGGDTTEYRQELARLSSPEQAFKDRLETLQHNVAMTPDQAVGNKTYLQGLIDLQKRFSNQLTMQTKRWLEENIFKIQQDLQITATVRSDQDIDRLVRDVTKKLSLTNSMRGQSFVFQ